MAVRDELNKLGLHFIIAEMGVVDIMEDITPLQRGLIKTGLNVTGLELIEDKNALLIDHLKKIITDKLNDLSDESSKVNFPEYLSKKLGHEYNSISKLFSDIQGTTIEKFIIAYKIEKVKELIIYGELNLTEIAGKLNYSSVAHLSNQFKKVTGLSPSHFRMLKTQRLKVIEDKQNILKSLS